MTPSDTLEKVVLVLSKDPASKSDDILEWRRDLKFVSSIDDTVFVLVRGRSGFELEDAREKEAGRSPLTALLKLLSAMFITEGSSNLKESPLSLLAEDNKR